MKDIEEYAYLGSGKCGRGAGATVYYYFQTWRKAGIWDKALQALRKQERKRQGRDEEPSAAVIDSQSIKTSAFRGESKGESVQACHNVITLCLRQRD